MPYNPQLLLKYTCLINVEIVCTINAVKYMFKYVYKGHYCAMMELQPRGIYKKLVVLPLLSAATTLALSAAAWTRSNLTTSLCSQVKP